MAPAAEDARADDDPSGGPSDESGTGTGTGTGIGTGSGVGPRPGGRKRRPLRPLPLPRVRVALLHSDRHTEALAAAMAHIHGKRDELLSSLLRCCGFLRETPAFLEVVPPRLARRAHLERFHCPRYLDLLECECESECEEGEGEGGEEARTRTRTRTRMRMRMRAGEERRSAAHLELLDLYGLTEDCHVPADWAGRVGLWRYCLAVSGASLHAARLLEGDGGGGGRVGGEGGEGRAFDVAVHWGGGRHHAHSDRAGGFCYVNDAVLAVRQLIWEDGGGGGGGGSGRRRRGRRVLYLDIDIHHADGVQEAFYGTDQVLTVSFHRRAPGFFPPATGHPSERGRSGTPGVGHCANLPLPRGCTDGEFLGAYQHALDRLVPAYDPDAVVLCVGADGVRGDPLAGPEGWSLSPEGLAEAVRRAAELCGGGDGGGDGEGAGEGRSRSRRRKLLVLGAGGYDPATTARTFLLCTAAACEAARPGMLWEELPRDVPRHEHFPRYGPDFELVSSSIASDASVRRGGGGEGGGSIGIGGFGFGIGNGIGNDGTCAVGSGERLAALESARRSIEMTALCVEGRREAALGGGTSFNADNLPSDIVPMKKKARRNARGGRRRRKRSQAGKEDMEDGHGPD